MSNGTPEEYAAGATARAELIPVSVSFGDAVQIFHVGAASVGAYGTPADQIDITPRSIEQLPPDYAEALAEAQTGEVVEPFTVPGTGADSWAVVRVTRRDEERPYSLEDARDQLISILQQNRMIEQMVEDLRARIHVAVLL